MLPFLDVIKPSPLEEYDHYWIAYPGRKISRDERRLIRYMGWRLQRHTRTNQEIWVMDKNVREKIFAWLEGKVKHPTL